jgi:hypothetical protein
MAQEVGTQEVGTNVAGVWFYLTKPRSGESLD